MTEVIRMTQDATPSAPQPMTVGQVAQAYGVTVRTLHHYDGIGLLVPSGRTAAGYRLYTPADLQRLQQVVVYRRLGLPLEEVATLLDDPTSDVTQHLRRQREAVRRRVAELGDLVNAIERALEVQMSGTNLTPQEQRELFGDSFNDDYAAQAQERWGETEAWRESRRRTTQYTKADWEQIKAEAEAVNEAFTAALRSGAPADSVPAMDAAEAHRRHIHDRFYDVSYEMHRGLGDLYLADPRFTRTYEDLAPGLAQYVRDAVHANADRHESGS